MEKWQALGVAITFITTMVLMAFCNDEYGKGKYKHGDKGSKNEIPKQNK